MKLKNNVIDLTIPPSDNDDTEEDDDDDCEDSPKPKKKPEQGVYRIAMAIGNLSCEISGPDKSWVATMAEPLTQFFILENKQKKPQDNDIV